MDTKLLEPCQLVEDAPLFNYLAASTAREGVRPRRRCVILL